MNSHMTNILPIESLGNTLGANWPNLRNARNLTILITQELSRKLTRKSHVDTGIVVFGSLGRNEFTEGSDIDWTMLIDGKAKSDHYSLMREISDVVGKLAGKKVGAEGTFGNMVR